MDPSVDEIAALKNQCAELQGRLDALTEFLVVYPGENGAPEQLHIRCHDFQLQCLNPSPDPGIRTQSDENGPRLDLFAPGEGNSLQVGFDGEGNPELTLLGNGGVVIVNDQPANQATTSPRN